MASSTEGDIQTIVTGLCCELCTIYTVKGRMFAIHPPLGGSIVWICSSCRDKVMQAQPVTVEEFT